MSLPVWKKFLVAAVVVTSGCGLLTASTLLAQKPEDKPAAAAPKKPAGRLPAFYKDIVDETQKAKIYDVQGKYQSQIDKLAEQVKALQKQRDTEIESLLTAEQKTKLEKARADSKAKAAERAAAKKAAGTTTVAKPAEPAPAKPVTPSTTTTKSSK